MLFANTAIVPVLWGLFHLASPFARSDAASTAPPPADPNLRNLSLHHLSSAHLHRLHPDLTLLRITHSTIGKIDKDAFDHLTHLNLLEISDSDIAAQIDADTFSRLPGLEILVLRNLGLRRVDLNLTNVQHLILARNEIEALEGGSIVGKNVNYLDVSGNRLKALRGTFGNLSKLSVIDISKNGLTDVGPVFEDNVNLLRILASENRITSTKGLTLPWLKNLDLFSNRISALSPASFPKMAALEELVLAFNDIEQVDDAFRDLLELKFLNLAWNRIQELQPHLFRNNLYLTDLSLQGNKLKSLHRFQSVHHHLTNLDLSHNHIALIDPHFFASTPALRHLDLSFNRLTTLADTLAPASELQLLNLAYNQLSLSPQHLSQNPHLLHLNLSSNALQTGLALFHHNRLLTTLDLSNNHILHFCDANPALKTLAKLNLRGNQVRRLPCLRDLGALCQVDVAHNPLACGDDLDDLIVHLATRGAAPHLEGANSQAQECEDLPLNGSLALWNEVRREICPDGRELSAEGSAGSEGRGTSGEDSQEESEEVADSESAGNGRSDSQRKQFLVVPIGWIGKDEMNKPNPIESPQSERRSWERIEENAELLKDLEEEEEEEENVRRSRFSWYTIALILIGLSLTLTCFNVLVFFYIKMKVWKRADATSPQKYTFLRNEVYKNTTEPTKVLPPNDAEFALPNHTHNKVLSFGKVNQFFHQFALHKNKDSESAKNVLIGPNSNDALNC